MDKWGCPSHDASNYFLKQSRSCRDSRMSHHKIIIAKFSNFANLDSLFIELWCENKILILFLSTVMDNDMWGRVRVTMNVFGFSVLGNIVDHDTNFISQKSGIIGQLWSKQGDFVHRRVLIKWTRWHDEGLCI